MRDITHTNNLKNRQSHWHPLLLARPAERRSDGSDPSTMLNINSTMLSKEI